MSLINTLTLGLIRKDGEWPSKVCGSSWKYGDYWISTRIILLPTYIKLSPLYLISLFGFKGVKIIIGKALGYSGCSHCHMTWNYVEGKSIKYSEHSGMFPLCEECFDKLTSEEIDPYIDDLIMQWKELNTKYRLEWGKEQTPQEIAKAAKVEVRRMKSID